MNIRIHESAKQEIDDGFHWYESQIEGLGLKFKEEVFFAIKRIQVNPVLYSALNNNLRRCLLVKFPYKVIYSIDESEIFNLAVAHQRRRPNYWSKRK